MQGSSIDVIIAKNTSFSLVTDILNLKLKIYEFFETKIDRHKHHNFLNRNFIFA